MKKTMWLPLIVGLLPFSVISVHAQEPPAAEKPAVTQVDKEKVTPDFNPKALFDGRGRIPFRAIDTPKMVRASEADFLIDDEYVLGVTVAGESRAYPTRFIWWHHVVNDKAGKKEDGTETFFAVTYCNVCNTGIRFDPVVNGKPLHFEVVGLYNAVVALYDRETDSVWSQVEGRALKGPLAGTRLKTGPLLDTTWKQWKELHPDTLVMSPETEFKQAYGQKGQIALRGTKDRFPAPYFNASLPRTDKRLPLFEMVLAVALPPDPQHDRGRPEVKEPKPGLHRVYPLKTLQEKEGALNDTLGETPVGVLFDPKATTATAFSRLLDGKTLTLEAKKQDDGSLAYYDKETGTRWNIEGKGIEGTLKDKQLRRLDSHLSEWYGWVAIFPNTSIYGRDDPPQPLDLLPPDNPPKEEKASEKPKSQD